MNDLNAGTGIRAEGSIQADSGIRVRSATYAIARTKCLCPHCGAETGVVALLLPPHHEVLSIEEEDGEDGQGGEGSSLCSAAWERAPRHAFLFYVESIADQVRRRLQAQTPTYRFALSPATQDCYWANHCSRCDHLQEDHDLFCEPEGAFLPVSPAAASGIELLPIPEALEAAAAGYAIDPQFIHFDAHA
jgi:hypothetical protein